MMIRTLGHDKVCGSYSQGTVRPWVGFNQGNDQTWNYHVHSGGCVEDIFYGSKGGSRETSEEVMVVWTWGLVLERKRGVKDSIKAFAGSNWKEGAAIS